MRVAGIATGDFLHGKGVVEALYDALKAAAAFERTEDPLFHPGKTARTHAGVLGELHPTLLAGHLVRVRARPRSTSSRRAASP